MTPAVSLEDFDEFARWICDVGYHQLRLTVSKLFPGADGGLLYSPRFLDLHVRLHDDPALLERIEDEIPARWLSFSFPGGDFALEAEAFERATIFDPSRGDAMVYLIGGVVLTFAEVEVDGAEDH